MGNDKSNSFGDLIVWKKAHAKDLQYINNEEKDCLYEDIIAIKKLLFSYSRSLYQNTSTDYCLLSTDY